MIRIACFDIGFASEDYAITNCKKYGGGALVGRYFKQIDGFELFAPHESFVNLDSNDRKENCHSLSKQECQMLQNGYPVDALVNLDKYDIVLHGHTCFSLNRTKKLNKPIVHWSGFSGTAGHPANHYILLYRKAFFPAFGEKAKYVKIGKDVPKEFQEYKKENFIFQCTQHCNDFDTISIAKQCIDNKIKGYFAGPIRDYPLLDFIDNENTFYLGIISEIEKLDYTKRAKLYTLPLNWDVVFNQSAIEANGLGTPILATPNGWFLEYIKTGVNGFFYNGKNLLDIYNICDTLSQRACWESAREFCIEEVVKTFYNAFEEIKKEWNYGK